MRGAAAPGAGPERDSRTAPGPRPGRSARPARTDRTARARPGHVSARDLLGLGVFGLRTRPTRVVLSALGIAIGIAAMIAVDGNSSSSQAALDRVLDGLGTNQLVAAPGTVARGETAPLPARGRG